MEGETWCLIDKAVGLQYEEAGLEAALSFLRKMLSALAPVERVLYSANRNGVTLAEGNTHAGELDDTGPVDERVITLTPRSMTSIPLEPGAHATLVDNSAQDGDTPMPIRAYHARCQSILTVCLFEEKDTRYYVALMSRAPHAFAPEHAPLLYRVTRSLAERLRDAYALGAYIREEMEVPYRDNAALPLLRGCKGLAEVMRQVEKVAPTDSTVLITGETGTGKEVLADVIHELSLRSAAPMVKVNCGGIPETLLESEFFGYERGAFTGAVTSHVGYFEQASDGTLLLDEVGDLSLQAQVRLLRVLERREIQRLGSTRHRSVNVRIIAATNRDLDAMVKAGTFREDLWYRLNVFPLHLPPLRWRKDDLPALVRHFMARSALSLHVQELPDVRPDELARLARHPWPGNLRELAHAVERAMILALLPGGRCGPLHFTLSDRHEDTLKARYGHLPLAQLPTLAEVTESYLRFVLQKTEGRIAGPDGAATVLDLPANTLRSRLMQMGLYQPGKRGRPRGAQA